MIFKRLASSFNSKYDIGLNHVNFCGSAGWVTLGDKGLNLGTIATIGVLATLILLVLVVVIIFFTHRRLNDENPTRKVSRSSTNQLIADVANGLAAHIEGMLFTKFACVASKIDFIN